ncbi:MAG: asparaginase [Candidatus Marinimicrobia bacterium]|jgi:L-asparaginase II|nr:asparaginase [Candidatus Neomarinimicrobiota bacterium]MBT3675377.1 asparaginase [Candidatus Neomarinimicrobiota bacterium]MBT3762348.1 asparaginase [Candidatus Neomarinimicrobiota bacterium]MBT4068123.1 asparaginase [Candidatus Neomarinimicrobiota bacterium]MBT4271014.1 asparaginase [Candidatus Neomarinimicrobiota bacterium]
MPILSKVIRGEFIESIHVAYGVAVDEKGVVVYASGDPHYLTCIRSTCKPFQASAAVKSGAVDAAGFSEDEIALMCASHNGEDIHVKTAQSMLNKLGFTTDDYCCGSHLPYDIESNHNVIRSGEKPIPLHNNCSGKHAGMLALSKHLGVDPTDYINKNHPVQKAILDQIMGYANLEKLSTAIDGCSAPTPFLTLSIIAGMFQKLASGNYPELDRLYNAMSKHPYLIGGRETFDTDFITAMKGRAVCKVGGEAIRGFGIRKEDGSVLGIVVKVLDGNLRALGSAVMAFLNQMELLTDDENESLKHYREPVLKNHRKLEVGKISTSIDF